VESDTNFGNLAFLDGLLDRETLMQELLAGAGGGVAAAVQELAFANVDWLKQGSPDIKLLKEIGLAAVVGVLGAGLTYDKQPTVALGMAGAAGGSIVTALMRRFVPTQVRALSGHGRYMPRMNRYYAPLAETRVREDEYPALGGTVRMHDADPASMAMLNAYGTY